MADYRFLRPRQQQAGSHIEITQMTVDSGPGLQPSPGSDGSPMPCNTKPASEFFLAQPDMGSFHLNIQFKTLPFADVELMMTGINAGIGETPQGVPGNGQFGGYTCYKWNQRANLSGGGIITIPLTKGLGYEGYHGYVFPQLSAKLAGISLGKSKCVMVYW